MLLPNHRAPVVSVQNWVRTGSADEGKGEEGISHFIEHLVFKGTESYGVGEIASVVEAAGGELNAWTSFDQTVFYINISKEYSDRALDVISEMMGSPRFDEAEIDAEREVVIEEIKRSNDSQSRKASRMLFEAAFSKHPYGRPVIGFDKVIKKVRRKVLVDYYQSRYVPGNMDLVVAGDFQLPEMKRLVQEKFGRLKPFKLRRIRRPVEPLPKKMKVRVDEAPFQEAQFHLAFRLPKPDHADTPALEVLAFLLGQGDSSRLPQRLRIQRPVVNSIGCSTFLPKDGGFLTVSAGLNLENLKDSLQMVGQELSRIRTEAPSLAEFQKALICFESEQYYSSETVEGEARRVGSMLNLMGDPKYADRFLTKVQALKPSDIPRVAAKYLVGKSLSAVLVTPEGQKAKGSRVFRAELVRLTGELANTRRSLISRAKAAKSKAIRWPKPVLREDIKITKVALPGGGQLILRPSRGTPVLSARACFLGGLRLEGPEKLGLTDLLSRIWTSGAGDKSEEQIQAELDSLAGGLSAFGGRNTIGLSLQGLAPFERRLASLLRDALLSPHLSESTLDRERVVLLEQIKSKQDHPSRVASQAFMSMMFEGHPYAMDPMGSDESVKSIRRQDVQSHLSQMARSGNLTLALSGHVDSGFWREFARDVAERLPAGAKIDRALSLQPLRANQSRFIQMDREQTHIMLGHRGLDMKDPRRFALRVAHSILSGMGGRLFVELREKNSLAYSVAPMQLEGMDSGYFGAYIACSPEKGQKAIAMMIDELEKLANKEPDSAELERAKTLMIGRHDLELQKNGSIADALMLNEAYGMAAEDVFTYGQRVREVTGKQVCGVLRELLSGPKVLVAVGKAQPW